jgi:hypothetical protein
MIWTALSKGKGGLSARRRFVLAIFSEIFSHIGWRFSLFFFVDIYPHSENRENLKFFPILTVFKKHKNLNCFRLSRYWHIGARRKKISEISQKRLQKTTKNAKKYTKTRIARNRL